MLNRIIVASTITMLMILAYTLPLVEAHSDQMLIKYIIGAVYIFGYSFALRNDGWND